MNRLLVTGALVLMAGCASMGSTQRTDILGEKPSYLEAATAVPNEQAIVQRVWTPGLDEGWVPQGLTVAGRFVFVAAYHPMPDLKANTGPCRVWRIEKASGRAAGHFDMPVGACTHAGGLAVLASGRMVLIDTRRIFLVDLDRALATERAEGAMKSLKLAGDLRGSFGAAEGDDLWIGTWTKDAVAKSRMYRLDPALFEARDGQTIDDRVAGESIPVPLESQGAAFAKDGTLWTSSSNGRWGKLHHLARGGRELAVHEMTAGLEDLDFDADGMLWAVSESGTRKYLQWPTKFPFVFALDVAKLTRAPALSQGGGSSPAPRSQ